MPGEKSGGVADAGGLTPGAPGYARALIAVLFAGLASFQALYATQALLPTLAREFSVAPASAALTVSVTTGGLAVAIIPLSVLSERFGRRAVIVISALAATVLGLVIALAPGLSTLIALRALQGLIIAGVPAVAMAYVSEEIHRDHVSRVMGLYISGTTVGGLLGRIIPSIVLEFASWRAAIFISAAVAFICALVTWWLLPRQRWFHPKGLSMRGEFTAILRHVQDLRLLGLFVLAFLFMGSFVSLYNYLGFELTQSYGLSPALAGFVFLLYLSGTWSSARAGVWAKVHSRRRLIAIATAVACVGLLLALIPHIAAVIIGVLLFTASFFVAHSLASSAVGLVATRDRAEASALYLFSYYLGSSVVGWLSGHVFSALAWRGLLLWLTLLALIAGLSAVAGLTRRR